MGIIRRLRLRIIPALFLIGSVLLSQPGPRAVLDTVYAVRANTLPAGDQVKASGEILMGQPYGFTRIESDTSQTSSVLQVAVHGYGSKGYEWVVPLVKLSRRSAYTYFYRYNWENCPPEAARELASSLIGLIHRTAGVEKLVLFGHSYGGIVVTFAASVLHLNIPVEVHAIASPLAGYPGILDRCDLLFDSDSTLVYPGWDSTVVHVQWKTQYLLDNAFNRLPADPQDVRLPNSRPFLLPATMNGHRLGHNWSVTWVVDEYLGNPHRR